MAIITFWNDNTGKIGQTYSTIGIGTLMGIENNYKTLLFSTKYGDQTLMKAYGTGERAKAIKMLTTSNTSLDLETGIEGMEKLIAANRLTPDVVPNYTKVILKDRLEILSAPKKKAGLDYSKIYKTCEDILNIANKYYDIIFVDLNNGIAELTTKEILAMSDIIIINIEQKLSEIEKISAILKDRELFKPEKIMVLMNNYDRKSKYTAKNMARELGRVKNILTVPYSNLFAEAIQEGRIAELFLNLKVNSLQGTDDRTAYFINELKKTVEAIVYKMQELQMRI